MLPARKWVRESLTQWKISVANRQTAAGRARAEHLPSEVSYKPTGHDLWLVIRVSTTFSPKVTVTFYIPHEKASADRQGQAPLALRAMGSCPACIPSRLEMVMLGWCWRISPGPQTCGSTIMLLLSFPFGSGVHLNVSRQIKVPRQLPTNYQGHLPQLERLNSTDRGSFTPVVEISTARDSNGYG